MTSGYGSHYVAAALLLVAQSGQALALDNPAGPRLPVALPVNKAPSVPLQTVKAVPPASPKHQSYGPAPKSAAPTSSPKDGKARKEQRLERQIYTDNCLSKSVTVVGRPIIPLFDQGERSTQAVRVAPALGISSCDNVLALPVDSDDMWDRRAQLLQARATHLIAVGAYDAALQSLDEADAIGATRRDMLFEGSLGIGNSMLRAYILGKQGKAEQARLLISQTRNLRPYASIIDRGLDRIENNLSRDIDAMLERSVLKIKWQPDTMRGLLPLFISRSNVKGAANFVDDVSTINPKPIGCWTISGSKSAGSQLRDDIEIQLQRAYVWSALGDVEKSEAIIATAQSDIAEFVGSKPVAEPGRKVSKSELAGYETRVSVGRSIGDLVARWKGVIQLRADTATQPAEALFDRADKLGIADMVVGLDLLRQLKFSNPAEQMQISAMIEQSEKSVADEILKLDIETVRDMLPEPEYLSDVPRFGGAGDGILFARENGFSQAKEKGSDIRTIRFGTTSGSGAMADELALLAVAKYAQKEGKDSFILLARRSIKRTTTVNGYYYIQSYSYDSGYESQLRVALLDSENLPPEWQGKRHRLIMVRQILEDIKPRYDALEAHRAASKSK